MNIYQKTKSHFFKKLFKNGKISFAQSGEDMILSTILWNVKNGFYIDIGANNPFIQSNTYHFYKKGWRGLNIDALPNSMIAFRKHRRKDINLECAISDKEEILDYYMFSSSFYNSFSTEEIENKKKVSELIEIRKIKTKKLSDILATYNIGNIDFMSIDVEGFDLNVLKSNDWIKYRPKILISEYYAQDLTNLRSNQVYIFLHQHRYEYFCNTPTNIFYIDSDFLSVRFKRFK